MEKILLSYDIYMCILDVVRETIYYCTSLRLTRRLKFSILFPKANRSRS